MGTQWQRAREVRVKGKQRQRVKSPTCTETETQFPPKTLKTDLKMIFLIIIKTALNYKEHDRRLNSYHVPLDGKNYLWATTNDLSERIKGRSVFHWSEFTKGKKMCLFLTPANNNVAGYGHCMYSPFLFLFGLFLILNFQTLIILFIFASCFISF